MVAKKSTATPIALETETTDDMELLLEDDEDIEIEDELTVEIENSQSPLPAVKVSASLSDIEALITEIDDSVEYLTWVIYGKNGTGKTTLLSTAEGVLVLAAEDGTLSIRGKSDAKKLKVDSWDKLEAVYWLLRDGRVVKDGIEIMTKSGKFVVKYLGIDTVTKLAEVCMRNVVLGEKDKDANKDLIKRTLKDWGEMSDKMKYWLQMFKELPVQNVWLFQETANSEDVEADEFSIFPAVNKSLRTYALSEADIIARTYIAKTDKGIQYRLNAAPNANYVTKDRTGIINAGAINNPSLTKLYDKIFNATN